jgi:hypothetical protein
MTDQNNTGNEQGGGNMEMHTPAPIVRQHSHMGPVLGVLIILLVLILGWLYLWGGMLSKEAMAPAPQNTIVNNEPETTRADADTQALDTVRPSDDLSAIDADVNSTNFDSIDTDMASIDSEFNTAASAQ